MKQDDIRYRWYKSDDARFWIVDEVLGHNLGFCRSESVAERLCSKLNLLEMEIVWNGWQSMATMPVVTVLPCLKNIFETYWNRTELVQNRDPMVASRAGVWDASAPTNHI